MRAWLVEDPGTPDVLSLIERHPESPGLRTKPNCFETPDSAM